MPARTWLYVGHNRTSYPQASLTALNVLGQTRWRRDHGNTVTAVAADPDGFVYSGGRSATSGYFNAIRKWDRDGTAITSGWPVNNGNYNFIRALCVAGGALYVGSEWSSTGSREVRKFNSAGSLQWEKSIGNAVYALTEAGDGHIIAVGARINNNTIRKLDAASGNILWSADHGAITWAVAVDADGFIYTGGDSASGMTIRKWSASGSEVTDDAWPLSRGDAIYGMAISGDLLIATGLRSGATTTFAHRRDTGAEQWTADYGDASIAAVSDSLGDLYLGGVSVGGVQLRKYTRSGTAITSGWPVNVGADVNALAMGPTPSLDSAAPGLPVALESAHPLTYGLLLAWPPGLALPLGLALPSGALPPPAVDFWGEGQKIYRGQLTGTLFSVALESLQCRRRRGDSTWLTVETTGNAELVARLEIAVSRGDQLVIFAGTRRHGTETLGEFLRATVTDFSCTQTPGAFRVSIAARVIAVLEAVTTRPLTGIQREREDDGRRQVRCEMNPLLRPGDTAQLPSGETFIAHNITYAIHPDAAWMEVQGPPNG